MNHGLPEIVVWRIQGVLASFPDLDRAILFGSRAKGTHRNGSDIDLALVGEALNGHTVGRIYDALDDLLLPYRFSLIILDGKTDPEVAVYLDRVGASLYERGWAVHEFSGYGRDSRTL